MARPAERMWHGGRGQRGAGLTGRPSQTPQVGLQMLGLAQKTRPAVSPRVFQAPKHPLRSGREESGRISSFLHLPFEHPGVFYEQQLPKIPHRAEKCPHVAVGQRSRGAKPCGAEPRAEPRALRMLRQPPGHTLLGTDPPQQHQHGAGGSSSQPAPCPSLPFPQHGFDHLHVTALLLLAGKSRTRSMPTALFGDSPSHGKSHEWACTRRHDHVILPGHAAFREPCGQGREGPRMRARRHRAATGAGLDTRGCSSSSLRPSRHNTDVLCAAKLCFLSCCSLRERCNLVGLEDRNQRKRRNWRNPGQRPLSCSNPRDSLVPAGRGQRCPPAGPASGLIRGTGRGAAGPWGQETGPQSAPRAAPAREVPSGAHTHPSSQRSSRTRTSPLAIAALLLRPSPGRGRGDPAGSAPQPSITPGPPAMPQCNAFGTHVSDEPRACLFCCGGAEGTGGREQSPGGGEVTKPAPRAFQPPGIPVPAHAWHHKRPFQTLGQAGRSG